MTEFYENVELPASFGGVDAVFRAAKGSLSKNKIKKKFESVDAYTLHKPLRKNFRRNRVIVYSVDQQWQADLVDMTHLQRHNNGYRYILTCIDILSKYAWALSGKIYSRLNGCIPAARIYARATWAQAQGVIFIGAVY